MSAWLSGQAIDHVVLERGEIANAWRHERWDSLRLLTPNWQSRLPGYRYAGGDPDGFMSMPDVIGFIDGFARAVAAPVRTATTVVSVRAADGGFRVVTQRGQWRCRAVVLASGAHHVPDIPACASDLPRSLRTLSSKDYRNPRQLDDRGVLIVGASATGLQLADEIQRSGREVTLAVGEHVRMPRLYRGLDIQRWMEVTGILDQRYDEVDDLVRARRVPSPQLTGTRATLDLNLLRERGVNIVGRLVGVREGVAQFSGSLRNHCTMADLKLTRLLDAIDAWIAANGGRTMAAPERFEPTHVEERPRLTLDLKTPQMGTVIWATGSRPDYSWLQVPALDRKGQLRHDGGVVAVPGMYALGLPFLRRRKSSFIHGAEDDVRELGEHLRAHLDGFARPVSWAQTPLAGLGA
jgi:putative flavoprotein involved in K+ transport